MKQRQDQAIWALQKAAQTPPNFQSRYRVGDPVWLEATHLKLPYQASKLNPKQYGPFRIEKVISLVAYCLELLNNWWIHNVFHASLLSPYKETVCHGPNFSQPPLDIVDREEEQEIEKIIDHRYFGKHQALQYLIKWKGFPKSDNEWVAPGHMHASSMVKDYHRRNPLDKGIKETTSVAQIASLISCLPS
jgi:hypothetical protein